MSNKEKRMLVDKKCPYCGKKLWVIGQSPKGLPIFTCVNCFLSKGTYSQMCKKAYLRNKYMEEQSSKFTCYICKLKFPVFRHMRHVLIRDERDGVSYLKHSCPECEEKLKEKKVGRTLWK